jgi:hypothetical protein
MGSIAAGYEAAARSTSALQRRRTVIADVHLGGLRGALGRGWCRNKAFVLTG